MAIEGIREGIEKALDFAKEKIRGDFSKEALKSELDEALTPLPNQSGAISEAKVQQSALKGKRNCPDCGTDCKPEDAFCPECGKYLKSDAEVISASFEKRKESISKIKEHLADDEKILAMFIGDDKISWYATKKRVIKYKTGLFQKKIVSLPYNQISSLSLKMTNRLWLLLIGIPLVIWGIMGANSGGGDEKSYGSMILIGIAISVIAILYGRRTYYQFTGSGLDEKEWKIKYKRKQKDIEEFIKIVEKQLG